MNVEISDPTIQLHRESRSFLFMVVLLSWIKLEFYGQVNTVKVMSSQLVKKKSKRKVLGVPQSQTAALPRYQEEEETDKTKQTQIEQTY